jgi:hypothetical protein
LWFSVAVHEKRREEVKVSDLTVQLEGLIYIDEHEKRALLVNAQRPRSSRANPMVMIPPHVPFLALAVEDHTVDDSLAAFKIKRVAGTPKTRDFQVYPLQQFAVSFHPTGKAPFSLLGGQSPGGASLAPGEAALTPENNTAFHWVMRMTSLTSKPLRKEARSTQPGPVVSAFVKLDHAEIGASRVRPGRPYRFIHTEPAPSASQQPPEVPIAEVITAKLKLTGGKPLIRLTPFSGGDSIDLHLRPEGPWTVIVGNEPLEDVVGGPIVGATMPDSCSDPLYHFEVMYDLFDMSEDDARPVPVCACDDDDRHARGGGGFCGPPGG